MGPECSGKHLQDLGAALGTALSDQVTALKYSKYVTTWPGKGTVSTIEEGRATNKSPH